MEIAKNRPRNHCPPPPSPYPWLVYCHGKTMKSQTFYSISNPQNIHVRSIPELRNKKVWNSCHGWLVLSSELAETDFHLWNPATLKSVKLPPLDVKLKQYITDCLLTAPPDDLDSSFLLFVRNPRSIIFCFIQDKKWITRGYDKEIKVTKDYLCKPLICNNQIYAAVSNRVDGMALIDIIKPSRMIIRIPNVPLPFVPSYLVLICNLYLVESCGNIFAIETFYGGINHNDVIGIQVFRMMVPTMTWEQVDSCPGRAFFISDRVAISCSALHSEMESRIYFTNRDNRLYSYSIEDKSISVSLPCSRIPTPWKRPFWIKPDIGSLDSFMENNNSFNEKQQAMQDMERLDKCTKVDRGEKTMATHLLDLPEHLVERIATHLSLFDYMNFRAVSNGCRSAAPPKKWKTTSVELKSNILSPWLMFPDKVKNVQSLVDPKSGGKYYVTIPQVLEGFMVTYSKYGWLLMWKRGSFVLFNPLTKSIIFLPDLIHLGQCFCFSSLPDSPDCVVVGIAFDVQEMYITRPRWTEWTYIEIQDNISFTISHLTYPVFLKDFIFFLGENGDLAVLTIDLEDDDIVNIEMKVFDVKAPCCSFQENFWVECDGEELFSVFIGKSERWVQVFKFNEFAKAWEKVENLGNNTIYICGSSSFATKAKDPEMKNKIYFPRFRDEAIIFYSLTTGNFHSSNNGESLTNYHGTREQLHCCWIEPRF